MWSCGAVSHHSFHSICYKTEIDVDFKVNYFADSDVCYIISKQNSLKLGNMSNKRDELEMKALVYDSKAFL